MARRKAPHIPDALLDQLLAGADPKSAFEADGLLDGLKKALAERALNAEMDHHLAGEEAGNTRNGYGRKTVTTETGRIELAIPRDRQATFDPQLIARYQRRFPGFDDKIVSMYARGMSTREIVGHLRELYGIEVSPDLISAVTDAVLEEVAAWQVRPLEPVYPLVFFDALRIKVRDEGVVPEQGRPHRARGARRRGQGDPRPVAGAERGRQVLVAGHERAQEPRRRGRAPGRCRRAEGLPRCDPGGVPRGDGSSPSLVDQAARRNRRRRRSRLARPYMARFKSLRRVIWPSACPLLQGSVSADRTASLS